MLNRPGQPHGGLSQSWIVFWFVLKDPSHHPGHLHLRQFPVVSLVSVQGPAPTVEPNIFGSFCSISNCSCQSLSSTEHSRASPPWTILLTDIWEEKEEWDIPNDLQCLHVGWEGILLFDLLLIRLSQYIYWMIIRMMMNMSRVLSDSAFWVDRT